MSAPNKPFKDYRVAITGASGSLGLALSKKFKDEGAWVIGLTHSEGNKQPHRDNYPHEWVQWKTGEEEKLRGTIETVDILIINHGINTRVTNSLEKISRTLDINSISAWSLMKLFFEVSQRKYESSSQKELWINTSEAEIFPALSPAYEISKLLLGQLASFMSFITSKDKSNKIIIRKLVIGPFKSELDPIGIMSPNFVAGQVINQAIIGLKLIIVTPNPLTYLLVTLTEICRYLYLRITQDD